jgi:hypothetical protein
MNVQKAMILKLLPVVAAALVGCIAQSGAPEESSSSAEALDVTGAAQPAVQAAPQAKETQRTPVRENSVQKNVLQQVDQDRITGTGPSDPSQDDGDGKEPDPHPWQPHGVQNVAQSSH